jgi:hypothetical protein
MTVKNTETTEEYEVAICPGCGSKLTGSREPGERDYCQDAEREVTLQPENKNYRSHSISPADKRDLFEPHHITVKKSIKRYRNGERNPPVAFEHNSPTRGVYND